MEKDSLVNRQPAVAGTFYPANPKELKQDLQKLYSICTPNKELKNIRAVISPHAGYVYSGNVAASAFNQLPQDQVFDNVFLIGSSHHAHFDGAALYSNGNYLTPLGVAKVNIDVTRKLIADHPDIFRSVPEIQANEHSLEVQVPFLQYLYGNQLQIVPIVIATNNSGTVRKISDALAPYFIGNNLFVISTDFSHYPEYNSACSVDASTANAIVKNSPSEFMQTLEKIEEKGIQNLVTGVCGWTSILTLLNITSEIPDIRYHAIKYMNSGDAPYGDKTRVVGYHAITVTLDNQLTDPSKDREYLNEQEKETLLKIAHLTLEEYIRTGRIPEAKSADITDHLKKPVGAFVTLTRQKKLRGCIGQFNTDKPLYLVIQEMTVSAAAGDYRFSKVGQEELDELEIEISILSPMHRIQSIDEIKMGTHGIYIKSGSSSGTFLPQVAKQTGWKAEEFLGHCARDKAGIGWDGWKEAEIYTFEAYVFG